MSSIFGGVAQKSQSELMDQAQMRVTMSEIRSIGRFPSGRNIGSGTVTEYPHGVVDGSYQGSFMITAEGDSASNGGYFVWWEAGRVANDNSKKKEWSTIKKEEEEKQQEKEEMPNTLDSYFVKNNTNSK